MPIANGKNECQSDGKGPSDRLIRKLNVGGGKEWSIGHEACLMFASYVAKFAC